MFNAKPHPLGHQFKTLLGRFFDRRKPTQEESICRYPVRINLNGDTYYNQQTSILKLLEVWFQAIDLEMQPLHA